MAGSVAMRVLGSGPAVMLVHGEVAPGPTWKAQEEMASRWRLVMVTRRGFRPSPAADRQDFAADARDLEKLLAREPSHCVGFSYGAVGVAVAAGMSPERFRSLTLIEPPLSRTAFEHLAAATGSEPEDEGAEDREAALRPPWEAEPDLEAVAGAGVPSLVLSGDHHPKLEEVCDALAYRLGAQRDRLPGAGHAVQRSPEFNRRLERFLFAAESGDRARSLAG